MSCIVYMVNCNYATHAICLLAFATCKYSELQGQLQNTHFFHSEITKSWQILDNVGCVLMHLTHLEYKIKTQMNFD
jgi:hypothetical protein